MSKDFINEVADSVLAGNMSMEQAINSLKYALEQRVNARKVFPRAKGVASAGGWIICTDYLRDVQMDVEGRVKPFPSLDALQTIFLVAERYLDRESGGIRV